MRRSAGLKEAATNYTRTHKAHPDARGHKFNDGEVVGVVLFEAGGNGPCVLELFEKALDPVALTVEERAEDGDVDATRHGFDVGPGAAFDQAPTERVAVVGPIGDQGLAGRKTIDEVGRALAVMGLALAELERDRIAVGIDQGMDLGGQSASRAPHASGWSIVPLGGVR